MVREEFPKDEVKELVGLTQNNLRKGRGEKEIDSDLRMSV